MWKCNKCGTMNEEELCTSCGAPRPEDTEDTVSEAVEVAEVTEVVGDADEAEAAEEIENTAEDIQSDGEIENADGEIGYSQSANETEEAVSAENSNWVCPTCGTECSEDVCPVCDTKRPEELTANPKKNGKVIALAAAVIAVVVIVIGIFLYQFVIKGAIDNKKNVDRGSDGLVSYSSIMDAWNGVSDDNVVMTVNGMEVPKDVFEAYLTNAGLYYQQEYCYADNQYDPSKLDKFKWTDVADKKTGETHAEKVITDTVNDCIEFYSILSLGDEHGIKLTDEDKQAVEDTISQYESQYGDEFETVLSYNGYSSVEQFKKLLLIDARVSAVYQDIQDNFDKYKAKDTSVYNLKNPEAATAKHILIKIDEANGVDDAAAKAKAQEVLKQIKSGADFDDMISQYNEDPSQPAEGYSFSQGQMVEEFENAVFALKVGEISGLVKTDFGYHIVKRVVGPMDIICYAKRNANVKVNKDLIKNIKVSSDLKALTEQAQAQSEAQAQAQAQSEAQAQAETQTAQDSEVTAEPAE